MKNVDIFIDEIFYSIIFNYLYYLSHFLIKNLKDSLFKLINIEIIKIIYFN